MRAIDIAMVSTDEKSADFTLDMEARDGETWKRTDSVAITSGLPDATRRVLLNDNERIVISARGANVEMVFDKDQNAAMPRHAFESQPTQVEKEKMLADHQAELKAGGKLEERAKVAGDRAADEARSRAIDEQRMAGTAKPSEAKPYVAPTSGAAQQAPKPPTAPAKPSHPGGGMTAPGPSTAGASSKDVK